MLDINYIIENKEKVKELLKRKNYEADIDSLCEHILEKRKIQREVEQNKSEQNKLSKSVPQVKKEGGDVTKIFEEVKHLAALNKEKEEKLEVLEKEINSVLVALPKSFNMSARLTATNISAKSSTIHLIRSSSIGPAIYPNKLRKKGLDFGIHSQASCLENVFNEVSFKRPANIP